MSGFVNPPLRRFTRNVEMMAGSAGVESDEIKTHEFSIQTNFFSLKHRVRKTLIAERKGQGATSAFARPPPVKRRKVPPPPEPSDDMELNARPSVSRSFAQSGRLVAGPNRIYRSTATQNMYKDVLAGYEDYLKVPTKSRCLEFESQIDPFLHVGDFADSEVSKTATGALTGTYTFVDG